MPVLLKHFQDDRVLLLELIVPNIRVVLIYHAARNKDVFHAVLKSRQFLLGTLFDLGCICLMLVEPLMDFLEVVDFVLFWHFDEEVHMFYEASKLHLSKFLFRCIPTFRQHEELQQTLELSLLGLFWILDWIFVPIETVFLLNFADMLSHLLFEFDVPLLLPTCRSCIKVHRSFLSGASSFDHKSRHFFRCLTLRSSSIFFLLWGTSVLSPVVFRIFLGSDKFQMLLFHTFQEA